MSTTKTASKFGEMQSDGSFNRIELYADGRHIVTYYAANGQAYFIHADWLGTERARSMYQGAPYETCTSLPFGDSLACIGADVSPLHFTGKMRDTETNLDYFGARYFSSGMGRWMSPDWADKPTNVPYANFSNPQGLNLYGYLRNNPLTMQDINGHGDWYDTHGKRIGNDGIDDHTINIADHIAMSSDGTLVDAMNSGVPISINQAEGKAIHSAVDRSNKKGPTDSEGGMHEEGFTEEGGVITPKAPGPSIKPGDKVAEITNISTGHETVDMHVHPRGDSTTNVGQSPSSGDMNGASNFSTTYIQAGAASNKVNIYNMQGVIATVPLSAVPQ